MEKSGRIAGVTEGLALILLFAALATAQLLIGGTRMIFCLPAYVLAAAAGLMAVFSWRTRKPAPSHLCLAISVVFLGYILGRALLSPVPYITRSDIYSVLGGLTVYLLVACVLIGGRQRMVLIVLLLSLALGHVVVGAIQFRDGTNFMPISWLQRYDYEWRASGFYVCPNHLAGLLEVLGVLGLSIVCWSRWPVWAKVVIAYAVGVCYVGLILTASRGGYLSAAASLLVFGLLSLGVLRRAGGRLGWSLAAVGVLAAVVLGAAAIFYVTKSDPLKNRAQTTFDVSNIRIDLWKAALEQWKLEPIIGTGSGTYLYYGRFFRTERVQRDPVYVHNDYLHLLAEYGLLGAVGFMAFLGVHLRDGLRNYSRLGPKRVAVSLQLPSNALALNIGAIAAVASFLVHSIFDFNLHIPANVLLLAFVFALLANPGVARERGVSTTAGGQLVWRFALPLLSAAFLVMCLRLLPGEYFSERARVAVRDQQAGLGLHYARMGLKYDPLNPDLHYRLGLARAQFQAAAENPVAAESFARQAIVALQRALSLAPREQSYALELAYLLDITGRFEEAETVFENLIQFDPKSESLRRYREGHLKRWQEGPISTKNVPEPGS